jgi:hypothetical protein
MSPSSLVLYWSTIGPAALVFNDWVRVFQPIMSDRQTFYRS